MSYFIQIRDYIGVLAPIILFVLSLFLLRNKTTSLTFFIVGSILNNILNILLKFFIQEPRPIQHRTVDIDIPNEKRVSFDKYGMPSGHAQNCGFAIVYITLTLNSPWITCLYLVISTISLLQRYLYNNHTILQLIVGLFIGSFMGYIMVEIAKTYIRGNIKMKKDDYFMG